MSDFLETCKIRQAVAQRRMSEAQAKFQAAQQELALAQQEFQAWSHAVNFETRREQIEKQTPASTQTVQPMQSQPVASLPAAPQETQETNQTELVRDALRQHPAGMTPVELWRELKDKVQRPYLYSVLKRLRDKDEVSVRRKRYYLRVNPTKTDEAKQGALVQ